MPIYFKGETLAQARREAGALLVALDDAELCRQLCADWPELAAAHAQTEGLHAADKAPPPRGAVVLLDASDGLVLVCEEVDP